jgi:MtN3 and saliva related transmembrane protein
MLGTIASGLAILSLMPQVIRTWRTQSAHDLSLGWLLIALLAMALWIAYGLAVGAPAVVWANAVMSLQVLLILWVKVRQAQRPDPGTRN